MTDEMIDYMPDISLDTRFGYNQFFTDGGGRFMGDGLYLDINGYISPHFSYSFNHRIASTYYEDNAGFEGTNWLTLTYETDNFAFTAGKDALLMGSFEYDAYNGVAEVLDNYGIGTRAYVATLDIADIFDARIVEKKFKPTPKFPASTRDLAIICDDELPAASLEKAIRAGAGKLLEKVELFDVYKGSSIAEGKKSVAYTMTLRAADRTLTVEECDRAVNKVLKELANIGAELRS
mgnify:CR=1 FL=1